MSFLSAGLRAEPSIPCYKAIVIGGRKRIYRYNPPLATQRSCVDNRQSYLHRATIEQIDREEILYLKEKIHGPLYNILLLNLFRLSCSISIFSWKCDFRISCSISIFSWKCDSQSYFLLVQS